MIRVVLPAHLRTLTHVAGEVQVDVAGTPSVAAVLDALETEFPVLRGRIRDTQTLQRRPFVRYFACEEDISHDAPENALPDRVVAGAEPLHIIGAMAGG